ncbi:MAG: glycosyltransferase family 4 protein [Candidatus Krumholzibacteriia bacterium]
MRILAIYKHYWPDTTPYARILRSILERWAADGHDARVLTAQPGYNDIRQPLQPWRETLGGVQVVRLRIPREVKRSLPRRLASFGVFLARAAWSACTGARPDAIIVNVHPPFLMGLTCRLIKAVRGVPYVYHCQDLHPESGRAAGQLAGGLRYRLLQWIDTGNCRAARLVVTLSPDMVATLADRGVDPGRIVVINNFILDTGPAPADEPSPVARLARSSRDDFVVLFAGNLGRYQALDKVMAAARLLRDDRGVRFLFMGEGAAKADLVRQAGDLVGRTVFFSPFQPLPVAVRAMEEADLALVSLGKGVHRVAYPSKTMMVLAAGCPVLAVIEPESSLAQAVTAHGLGLTCAQDDPAAIAAAVLRARTQRLEWRRRRPEIAAWAQAEFGREQTLDRWSELAARLAAGS